MSRVVLPNLFSLLWAPGNQSKEGPGLHLRWSLRPELGLPRAHFVVWVRAGGGSIERTDLQFPLPTPFSLDGAVQVLEWDQGPMAAVTIDIQCDAGQWVMLRGYDGPGGTGKLIDEAVGTLSVPLTVYGSAIRSVIVVGRGRVMGGWLMSMDALVNSGDWVEVERVGLPVDERWASSGYPIDRQGPAGGALEPVEAAARRLALGGPESGWAATNDRGQPMPPWSAPSPQEYVRELRKTLLPDVLEMLAKTPDPHHHARYRVRRDIPAPRSIHGDAAVGKASADIAPLGALLASAGTDPFAALGLGFGTFLSFNRLTKYMRQRKELAAQTMVAQRTAAGFAGLVMVTVDHELAFDLPVVNQTFREKVTLADVIFHPVESGPPVPTGLRAERFALDRPAQLDGPFFEALTVAWRRPQQQLAEAPHPRSFAIGRALGGANHELLLAKRHSGGHQPFVASQPTREAPDPEIKFADRGVPEPQPSPPEPPGVVYSVAAQDWFGRWSAWTSVDHARVITQPQVPAIIRANLVPKGGAAASQAGEVEVEFVWNWQDRSPETIVIEVKLHEETGAAPAGSGTVARVGGGIQPSWTAHFGGAEGPPPGLEILPDDHPTPGLVRYKATITGLSLDFGAYPKIAASVRMMATEHRRPAMPSGWSRTLRGVALSPVPPPRPAAPPGMIWASLPDPRGVSRATLTWTPTPGARHVILGADETAVRRELGLPGADPQTPVHQRLLDLRGRTALDIRRAFRRVAEDVTSPAELALPKGSRLIHFYTVVSISDAQIESPFPGNSSEWFAVATPRAAVPEAPQISTRSQPGGILVELILPAGRDPAARVELHRTGVEVNATDVDRMGAPIASTAVHTPAAPWQRSVRSDGSTRLTYLDSGAPADWSPQWYRAVAWTASDDITGLRAARSPASAPSCQARPRGAGPVVSGVSTQRVGAHILVRWSSDLPRLRSPLGVAAYAVTGRSAAGAATQRLSADLAPRIAGDLPPPTEAPAVFIHDDPVSPEPATYCAWLAAPADPVEIIVQATDPAGRSATLTTRHEDP